jgi:hypothetical protein
MPAARLSLADILRAALALLGMALALWMLRAETAAVSMTTMTVGETPARIFRPASPPPAPQPAIAIAHGFAGSQQLMQSFAITLAKHGYTAITFDFAGHGRNPAPLMGSITEVRGATQTLLAETQTVVALARTLGDGRVGVLGHSMASDIIVRAAQADPTIAATVAVSMFSPVVTADSPRNLLVIVGDWEGMLKREALRVVGLAVAPAAAEPGVTYGDPAAGTARRAAFSPFTEHATVLFSSASTGEALAWYDTVFGVTRPAPPEPDQRGPWIALLIASALLLAHPLSRLLPPLSPVPLGASLPWRRMGAALLIPMVATPLILRFVPTHFLPVLVGDYLAVHFALYGVLSLLVGVWLRRWLPPTSALKAPPGPFWLATGAVVAFGFVALVWPIDRLITSFWPGPERMLLLAAMLVGTLSFFLSLEWLTRGANAARGAYTLAKVAFLISLGLAVALDFQRLFFLIIIVPIMVLFLLVYGLIASWTYRATGHPFVGAIANAVAFAWAISTTFPLLGG